MPNEAPGVLASKYFKNDIGYSIVLTAAEEFSLRHGASQSKFIVLQRPLILFLFQYLLLKLVKCLVYPRFFSPLRNLPGPKDNFPLMGQVINQLKQTDPNSVYLKWVYQYPDTPFIRYLSFGNSEQLLVNSLKAYKEVLQTQCYAFIKPVFFKRLIGGIVGDGLLFKEGEEHKRERRLLASSFSHANLKALIPVFHEKSGVLVTTIQAMVSNNPEGVEIEMLELFTKTTLDIIGVTTLGIELDNLRGNSSLSFEECFDRILNQSALGNIIAILNMYIPLRSWLPLEANRQFVAANNELRRQLNDVIKARRQQVMSGEAKGSDLMTSMMRETVQAGRNPWTDQDILYNLLGFLAAGHETTADALTWAIYCLCVYPGVQDKLRTEIVEAFPMGFDDTPIWEKVESLHYLNIFLKEVLRLYSSAIAAFREATSDLVIEGVHIPKGTTINVNIAAANLHPLIWGPDAREFRPERWDSMEKGDAASDPFAFESFINGPRICIGKAFATLEMKVVLVAMMRSLKFEWLEGVSKEVELLNTFVRRPKNGMKVRVRDIQCGKRV